MSTIVKFQIFLLVLTLGFLTGPRVMLAIQKLTPDEGAPISSQSAQIGGAARTPAPLATIASGIKKDPYENISLNAKSVYVWDIAAHKKLYGKSEHTALPLASVTKIMMAVVAKELLPADQKITIHPADLMEEGDTGLLVGEVWKLDDLLKFTLVGSSNDGASAIAGVAGASLARTEASNPFENKKLFIAKMNEKARAMGLSSTYFRNESGLDLESLASGAHGSARDMGMLFEYVFENHPDLFTSTTYAKVNLRSENDIVHRVTNTNQAVGTITGIIGSKTGYTDLAGGNLVVVVDIGINHPVVIAVLGSTRDGRFTDVEQLINATVETITGQTLAAE